jgi:hypothetical protein
LDSESAPTEIPRKFKNNLEEKKSHKNNPKKRARALPFVLARWRKNKKVGVEQEKVGHVRLANQSPPFELDPRGILRIFL